MHSITHTDQFINNLRLVIINLGMYLCRKSQKYYYSSTAQEKKKTKGYFTFLDLADRTIASNEEQSQDSNVL